LTLVSQLAHLASQVAGYVACFLQGGSNNYLYTPFTNLGL